MLHLIPVTTKHRDGSISKHTVVQTNPKLKTIHAWVKPKRKFIGSGEDVPVCQKELEALLETAHV